MTEPGGDDGATPAGRPTVDDLGVGHLPAVVALERICFVDPWPEAAFARELVRRDEGGYPRVLSDDGAVRAYSIAWFVADEAHLANLAVAPSSRRRGYGRVLLRDWLQEARRRGSATAWLEVRAGNDAARRLYEAHGFRIVGVRKGYYRKEREDAIVMTLALAGEGN